MKSIIISVLMVASLNVLASNHVGEYLELSGLVEGHKASAEFTVIEHDKDNGKFKIRSVLRAEGNGIVEVEEEESLEWTKSDAALALIYCEDFYMGELKKVTLLGKPYDICELEVDEEEKTALRAFLPPGRSEMTIWIGEFPVSGIGKISSDGVEVEVSDLTWN